MATSPLVVPTTTRIVQTDNHLGALTVEETLSFAYTCQQGKAPPAFDIHSQILEAKVMPQHGM